MAKIESAAEFNKLVEAGHYETKTNAQRAAGRTRLPDAEKRKAFDYIESHFGADGASNKPAQKPAKKSKKKASKKMAAKAVRQSAPPPAMAAETGGKKKAKKKAAARKVREETPGSMPIAPSQVRTVSDILQVIDSTVSHSVSILEALRKAHELNNTGDISAGVSTVKEALVGAAQLLNNNVIHPLQNMGSTANAGVAERLQQVVDAAASTPLQAVGQIPPPPQDANFAPS